MSPPLPTPNHPSSSPPHPTPPHTRNPTIRPPGKSGSVFFLSADDQLLVKTIRKTEAQLLQRLLPRYYGHMMSHPNSLLVRVLGLYSITSASSGGRKVRGRGPLGVLGFAGGQVVVG